MAVSDLINSAQGYAASTTSAAQTAMAAAAAAVQNVGYTQIMYEGTPMPEAPDSNLNLTLPTLDDIEMKLATDPGDLPTFQDVAPIEAGNAPTLSASAPTLTLPTKPNQVAAFTDQMPAVNTEFDFPEVPAQLSMPMGDMPTITDRVAPIAPNVNIPTFTGVMPTGEPSAPVGLEKTFALAYTDAAPQMVSMINGYVDAQLNKVNPQFATQMEAIETQLTKYLQGGTALNPTVENAIYERAKSKNNAEALRVRDQAIGDFAARGFTMPGGALLSALQQARQGGADNNAKASTEIAIAQAEMEQKNLQFAVSTSANLRTTLLNATYMYMQNLTSINSQALDYSKSVLNAIIETYNTAVKVFSLKLEAYKTDAQVYEMKIRGALAMVEVYKAEIQAMEALVNVDRVKVEVYKARIETLMVYANLYKAQVEVVVEQAQLEKVKLDMFQAKVQAYSATVQAKNAEWQGYNASIEGEVAKVKVFESQVGAFNAQVNGYRAVVDSKAEVAKVILAANQSKASAYQAKVQAYGEVTRAYGEVARTKLENQRQQVVAFQAKTAAEVSKFQVKSDYYKATAQIGIENARLTISTMIQSAENLRKYGESLAHISSSNASVYAHLASSAMSGMNSLAAETQAL